MALRQDARMLRGQLHIEEEHPGCISVWFDPDMSYLEDSVLETLKVDGVRTLLARIDATHGTFYIYPIVTTPSARFLKPKYGSLAEIVFECASIDLPSTPEEAFDFLQGMLPDGFIRDADYGLGIDKEFNAIIECVHKVPGITSLVISGRESTHWEEPCYFINEADFDRLRRGMHRITSRFRAEARVDRSLLAYDFLLHGQQPETYPPRGRPYRKDTIFKILTGMGDAPEGLSAADRKGVVSLVEANAKELAHSSPERLYELQRTIELVTLNVLIEKFAVMLEEHHLEGTWQNLFDLNPFILGMIFGYPIVKLAGRHLGGRGADGTGEKITDFLTTNTLTSNLALLEIKTPGMSLFGAKYREGVLKISADLSGAVMQVLDQRMQLQSNIHALAHNSKHQTVEAFHVACILVAGSIPKDDIEKKNLELFRNGLKDITIITFDEVLEKMKALRSFLTGDTSPSPGDDGLPF